MKQEGAGFSDSAWSVMGQIKKQMINGTSQLGCFFGILCFWFLGPRPA
jgi:hypothetical protein